ALSFAVVVPLIATSVAAQVAPSPRAERTAAADDKMGPALTAYRSGQFEAARLAALPLARQGNVTAQLMLGSIYNNGEGIEADPEEAAKWFAEAAAQGNAGAQY